MSNSLLIGLANYLNPLLFAQWGGGGRYYESKSVLASYLDHLCNAVVY